AFVHLTPDQVARLHIDLEKRTKQLVTDVFFAFADEACDLGREGRWDAERIRNATEAFLHQIAVRAYLDKRAGCGLEVFERELKAEIETSDRWKECRQQRLAIARGQTAPEVSNTKPAESPIRWEDIEIRFLSDERVQIFVDGRPGDTKNFAEMGFEDHRGK